MGHDLTRGPETDPHQLYRYRDGLYAADLIAAAACEFDFFSRLAREPMDLEGVCRAFGVHTRPADVMLSFFAANGLVKKEGGRFHATATAVEHLTKDSPRSLIPYYASLKERPVARDFAVILRTDRPANWGSYKDEKPWTEAMLTEEFATGFTAAMDCRGFTLGPALLREAGLAGRRSLLDVAGGSGIYACVLAQGTPGLRATVLERPPVDGIARTMIRKRGCEGLVSVTAGDIFRDPLPKGHDVHLFSNVLHDWDVPKVRTLLAASAAALEPGSLIVIHDAHLNESKDGPLPVTAYSALLMSVTEGRCYGVGEMRELLTEAGFGSFRFAETACDRSVITAVRK